MNQVKPFLQAHDFFRLRHQVPTSSDIRFEVCTCFTCGRFGMLSYRLPFIEKQDHRYHFSRQACMYWCPNCGVVQPGNRARYPTLHWKGGDVRAQKA